MLTCRHFRRQILPTFRVLGGIAQLVERRNGIAKVIGSRPFTSTILPEKPALRACEREQKAIGSEGIPRQSPSDFNLVEKGAWAPPSSLAEF